MQLPASVTLADVGECLQRLDAALAAHGGGDFELDASALQQFDSAAVALLLHAQRGAQARQWPLSVTHTPPKLAELAQLYGVESLLPLTM